MSTAEQEVRYLEEEERKNTEIWQGQQLAEINEKLTKILDCVVGMLRDHTKFAPLKELIKDDKDT